MAYKTFIIWNPKAGSRSVSEWDSALGPRWGEGVGGSPPCPPPPPPPPVGAPAGGGGCVPSLPPPTPPKRKTLVFNIHYGDPAD